MRSLAIVLSACAAIVLLSAVVAQGVGGDDAEKKQRLLVRAQEICPVSGRHLMSMGGPIPAKVGDQSLFLCCQGCFGRDIQQQHWIEIHTNWIAAQGECPVMGKPLPEKPSSTVVKGRKIFVCCPPCTEKIEAAPEQHLAKVDALLEENLDSGDSQR